MPFAATLDATQRAAGVAPKGSPRFETGKSIGQMLGGMGLMVLGGIGTGGGFVLSLSQIGAAIGIPVVAISVGVTITGMANPRLRGVSAGTAPFRPPQTFFSRPAF